MTLIAEFTAAQSGIFINRCLVAAVAFAINIIKAEPVNTVNHINRANFAKSVVLNPSAAASQLALGIIALNASSDGSLLTDQQVNDGIAAIWDIYAGVV